ncbi:MAG: ubiquinol oxidase subunit II, partial [Candidatus Saccharimonadales bacterium]
MIKSRIPKSVKITLFLLLVIGMLTVIVLYLRTLHIDMLNPAGIIALKERDLMAFTVILGAVVIIPVFALTIAIAWRYRESNTKAKYTPEWAINHTAEAIWWGIPILIIVILSIVTWNSTHNLDPYKPLPGHDKTLTIQVVALDWKWLFIYPEQNIATVNYVQFPTNTSINFDLTSDSVMTSFWIPKLSGQLYAMPGMVTKLHLNATQLGDYKGSNANISGEGFAGMKFTARASSEVDFNRWIAETKQKPLSLTTAEYLQLAEKSKNNPPAYYSSAQPDLYDTIVMKYI